MIESLLTLAGGAGLLAGLAFVGYLLRNDAAEAINREKDNT